MMHDGTLVIAGLYGSYMCPPVMLPGRLVLVCEQAQVLDPPVHLQRRSPCPALRPVIASPGDPLDTC